MNDQRKTAIITGASSGIGCAIAERFAKMKWRVVLCGRRPEKLQQCAEAVRSAGGEAVVCVCDVTVPEDVARLVEAAGSRLDVLVHSAGQGHCLTIDELDYREWKDTLEVSVSGAFLCAKAALPLMRKTRDCDGYIIQICSLASGGTWHLEVGYGTAKAAQLKFALHLTEQFQLERKEGGRIIHSRALCPGTTDTAFWDRIPQRKADLATTLTADNVAWVVEQWINNPAETAESLEKKKPRADIVIKRHRPFEAWDEVVAIAHESHP